MAPNGLSENPDPSDPGSMIRWTSRAAAAFEAIKEDVHEIKAGQAANAEWRISTETRLTSTIQLVSSHGEAIRELRTELRGLPDEMRKAIADAIRRPPNPGGNANGGDKISFKWALEKVAVPLLLAGTGSGITIMVAKAIGAFGSP